MTTILFTFLAVSQQEAAVYIGALGTVVVAIISGTYLVISSRKPARTGPDLLYDSATAPTGATPVEMWLNRFERIERYQLWTMAVLVGQGAAFFLYCFVERADRKADAHRMNDRIDLLQLSLERKGKYK